MNQHLHAVGAAIGEQLRVVRMCGAEHLDHTGQLGIETSPHIQRVDRQPHFIDADHRSHSRSHAAHCAASEVGQLTVID
ncbi:hypothetical protein [Burkholderia ubonensis]|uniref:hypothetical protein n=1 Tax=Burkholderia ubonensis TaxID=101571 RepID=UPI0012FAEB45|nr:hypothetical protein [Burkholderia ubonensis]